MRRTSRPTHTSATLAAARSCPPSTTRSMRVNGDDLTQILERPEAADAVGGHAHPAVDPANHPVAPHGAGELGREVAGRARAADDRDPDLGNLLEAGDEPGAERGDQQGAEHRGEHGVPRERLEGERDEPGEADADERRRAPRRPSRPPASAARSAGRGRPPGRRSGPPPRRAARRRPAPCGTRRSRRR